jgi:hemoglobin-like flavoprotein
MQKKAETTRDLFLQSLERCLATGTFIGCFYERFIASSPDVRARFAHTDMARQQEKLTRSLRMLAAAVVGAPAGLRELAERAETHGRRGMRITPDLYELWSAAILATAREHDPQWSPDVEAAWVSTLNMVVQYMINRA